MLSIDKQIEKISMRSRAWRNRTGNTLTDISRKTGVCIASIHNLENGKRSCTLDTTLKILNAEGLTLIAVPIEEIKSKYPGIDEWNSPEEAERLHKIMEQAIARRKS